MLDPNNRGSITGQLREFQLVELVQAMGLGGSSGALHLTHGDGRRGVIYFEDGALTWCREYDSQALTFGAVLQQLGYVDVHTVEENANRQVTDPLGELLGQQLVERHVITPNQLAETLKTQMLWSVREMAIWQDGDYSFNNGELPPPRTATQHVETSRITMEIVRYQHEWSELSQWLPDGMRTVLRMAAEPPVDHALIFPTAVWRVITRVNAFQTPRRIATALYQTEMDTARMLAPLVRDALLYASLGERSVGLPHIQRSTSAQHVDIFGLLSRMEQEWHKRKVLADQLAALGTFINWTMDALAEVWAQNNLTLATDSLSNLLRRVQCNVVAGHQLRIERNHIQVDDLANYLKQMQAAARRAGTGRELQDAYTTLSAGLQAVFDAINMRIDSPQDRGYYEAAWSAMFTEFEETLRPFA